MVVIYLSIPGQTTITLQLLKLKGTKIRDSVVLSRYSRYKWFVNNLSIFKIKAKLALMLSHRMSDLKLHIRSEGQQF